MIRLVAVAIVLAVATSAQAYQPDGTTTQARQARQLPPCYWPGQVRKWGCPRCGAEGICMLVAPPLGRHRGNRKCVDWSEGFCAQYQ